MAKEKDEKLNRRKKRRYKRKVKSSVKITAISIVLLFTVLGYAGWMYHQNLNATNPYGDVGEEDIDDRKEYNLTKVPATYTVLNVGGGEAILVSYKETEALIDAGSEKSSKKLLKALKGKVKGELDYLILTSGSDGRVGGAAAVVGAFDVTNCFVGEIQNPDLERTLKENVKELKRAEGTTLPLGQGVSLSLIKPKVSSKEIQDRSIITYFQYVDFGFLALSDAGEEEISRAMPSVAATSLAAVVLPQHGNADLAKKLADTFRANYYVASTSDKKLPETLFEWYRELGVTAVNGEMRFDVSDDVTSSLDDK